MRYVASHVNDYGEVIEIEIVEVGSASAFVKIPGNAEKGFYSFEHERINIEAPYQSPFQKGSLSVHVWLDSTSQTFVDNILSSQEGEYRITYKIDSTIVWVGNILPDLCEYDEFSFDRKSATLVAKDGSLLRSYNFPLEDNRQTLINVIARCLNELGFGLNIITSTSWVNENITLANDYLRQIYIDTFALREYARSGDEVDTPITVHEALEQILSDNGLILKQWKGWRVDHISAYTNPASVIQATYGSDGSFTSQASVDKRLVFNRDNQRITLGSVNRGVAALRQAKVKFNHRTQISILQAPESVFLAGGESEAYSRPFFSTGDQFIEIRARVTALSTTDAPTATARVKIRAGQYYFDGSDWTLTDTDIDVNLTGGGVLIDSDYEYTGNLFYNTPNIPADANSPLELTFYSAVINSGTPVAASQTGFLNVGFSVINPLTQAANSTSIDYQLTQTGDYSTLYTHKPTFYGDGPGGGARSALRYSTNVADFTSNDWQRRGSASYRNYHLNLLKEIMDFQRGWRRRVSAIVKGLYDPSLVSVYDSQNFFYLSGSQDGFTGNWNTELFIITEATGTDTFETILKFSDGQSSTQVGTGSGSSDTTTLDGRYLRRSQNLGDVASASDARDNLSVYSIAEVDAIQLQNDIDLVQLGLQDDALFLQKADKGIQVTLTPSGGLTGGGTNNLSADSEFGVSIADSGVTTVKINDSAVTTAKIADLNVTTGKLADDAVTTVKILDSNVTNAKLANSTISGKALGTNLDSLTAGNGLSGTAYNGSSPQTWAVDPTAPIKITTGKVDLGFVAPLILTGSDLDVQDAGVAQRGVVSISAQVFKGEKTLEDTGKYKVNFQSDNFLDVDDTYTGVQLSQSGMKVETIRANELRVKAFIAEISAALYGEDILTKSRGVLSRDFTIPAVAGTATLYVEDLEGFPETQVFEANDFVRLRVVDRSGGGLLVADVWGQVTAYSNLAGGEQSWTFTRTAGGSATTGDIIYAGSIAIDYGVSGDGVIVRSVIGDNTPRETILTWVTDPAVPANYTLRTRIGNLNGSFGITDDIYGVAVQDNFIASLDGGNLKIGKDADGTNDGIYFDANNYWLLNEGFKVQIDGEDLASAVLDIRTDLVQLGLEAGGAYSGIQFLAGQTIISASEIDGEGRAKIATVRLDATNPETLVGISADAFLLETNNLFIDSAATNNGLIALGATASGITVANNNAGIALDGDGNFKAYGNADNLIRKSGTSLEIKSTNAIIKGGDLTITGTSTPSIAIADSFRKVTINAGTTFPTIQTRDSGSGSSTPFAVGGSWDSAILLQSLFAGDVVRLQVDVEYASSGGAETQEFEVTVFENDGGGNNVQYTFRDKITGASGATGAKSYDIEFPAAASGSYIGSEGWFVRVDSIGTGTGNFEVTNASLIHYNSETYINKGGFKIQKSPNGFLSNNEIKGSFAVNVPIITDTSTAEAIFLSLNKYQGQLVMVRNQVEDPSDASFGIPYYQLYQVGEYGAL